MPQIFQILKKIFLFFQIFYTDLLLPSITKNVSPDKWIILINFKEWDFVNQKYFIVIIY